MHETLYGITAAADGDAIICGRANRDGGGDEFLAMRLDGTDGSIDWFQKSGGPGDGDDRLYSILVDADGNAIATGVGVDIDDSADFVTIKYDGASGEILWQRRVSGAVNNENRAGWLGRTAVGDVIMANRRWVPGESFNIVVHRYAGVDGAVLWTSDYNGPASGADDLRTMRLDGEGNPVVVGVSEGNFLALRFDAADGSLLWDAMYDGPMGWYDLASCLAFDANGNVLVGGYTDGGASFWDATTVAFDLTTGAELWSVSYDGADGLTDEVKSIAVSDGGLIYACGNTYSYATDMDMLAVQYSLAATGLPTNWQTAPNRGAYPNPFRERTTIRFSLAEASVVDAAVYDVRGRLTRRLADGRLKAGEHPLVWDGLDESGRPAPSGVYLIRVSGGRVQLTSRVLRID